MTDMSATAAELRENLRGELAAITDYERSARVAESEQVRDLFRHIADEERHHVAEEFRALMMVDPDQARAFQEVFRMKAAGATGGASAGATSGAFGGASGVMTRADLSRCDGQSGRPAYVAVDGIVYDVTAVRAWAGGRHHGLACGCDLSVEFASCMDRSILVRLPKVAVLEAGVVGKG